MLPKVTCIIQARMSSARLPNKMLRDLGGRPTLEWVYLWCMMAKMINPKINEVIVATSDMPEDNLIADWCEAKQITCFRGTLDPLARFYECAKKHEADVIIRICGDCPLISFVMISGILDYYLQTMKLKPYRALAFLDKRIPGGWDCEVFSMELLKETHLHTRGAKREHVTQNMRKDRMENFLDLGCDFKFPDLKLDLDTQEDYERISELCATILRGA